MLAAVLVGQQLSSLARYSPALPFVRLIRRFVGSGNEARR